MSISALYDLQNEMNRIGIAGVQVAIGDMKLKKIHEEMKKSGEKVAVFSKIAELIKKLIESGGTKDFYELSRLSSSVLYTQGITGKKGDLEEIGTIPMNHKTSIPFRSINPVIEALTTKGSGRLEIITNAYEAGAFKDLRIIQYLMHALSDSYSEIADFVLKKLIEVYGEEIVPIAKKGIDFNGKNEHSRRINIISQVAKGKEKEFYLEALEKGSKEVRISAVYALKDCPDVLDIVLQYTKDKNKEVREAAYTVAGAANAKIGTEVLIKAFKAARDFNICLEGVTNNLSIEMAEVIVEEADKCLESIVKDDKNLESIDKLYTLLGCMENKKYDIVYEFIKKFLLKVCQFKVQRFNYVIDRAGLILEASNRAELIEFLIDLRKQQVHESLGIIGLSFATALKHRSAKDIFDMYSEFFKKKPSGSNYRYSNLIEIITEFSHAREWVFYNYDYSDYKNVLKNIESEDSKWWDKRWLKVFMNLNEIGLVCRFASKEEPECINYLLEKLDEYLGNENARIAYKKMNVDTPEFIFGLLKAEHKDAEDLIIHSFKKGLESQLQKRINTIYYDNGIFCMLNFLPKSRSKEIEEIKEHIIAELTARKVREDFVVYLETEFNNVKYIEN